MAFPNGKWYSRIMKETTVQIDQAGRVVLPKPLRDRFRLRGGDTLTIEVKGDAIELRPAHDVGQLKRINGVLVFSGPGTLPAGEDLVGQSRDERINELTREAEEKR
jgi:AbrB family looped-hinge helix DNA binding protein